MSTHRGGFESDNWLVAVLNTDDVSDTAESLNLWSLINEDLTQRGFQWVFLFFFAQYKCRLSLSSFAPHLTLRHFSFVVWRKRVLKGAFACVHPYVLALLLGSPRFTAECDPQGLFGEFFIQRHKPRDQSWSAEMKMKCFNTAPVITKKLIPLPCCLNANEMIPVMDPEEKRGTVSGREGKKRELREKYRWKHITSSVPVLC